MTPIAALAWVVFAFIPVVSCQWFQPSAKRELWHVGDVHNIPYNTDLTSYTITLWQQAIAGGSATPGPIIYQTKTGAAKVLGWTVQLYDFDLESSNIFFFWLKEGGAENATGPIKGRTMSSAYFNITNQPSPTTTSSSLPSSSTESSTDLSTALSSTSSTATRPAVDQGEATASSRVPGEDIGGTNGETEGGGGEGGGGGGSLPVGAQVGIGVGVSVVGVVVIICGILWFRYLRKQQQILLDLQRRAYPEPPPPDAAVTEAGKWQAPPHPPPPPPNIQYYPVYELGYHSGTPPAELGCPPSNRN